METVFQVVTVHREPFTDGSPPSEVTRVVGFEEWRLGNGRVRNRLEMTGYSHQFPQTLRAGTEVVVAHEGPLGSTTAINMPPFRQAQPEHSELALCFETR